MRISGQGRKKPQGVIGTKARAERSPAQLEGSLAVLLAAGDNHPHPHLEMTQGESRAHPLPGTIGEGMPPEADSLREADLTAKEDSEPAPAPQNRKRKAPRAAVEHHRLEEAHPHQTPLLTQVHQGARLQMRPMRTKSSP